MSISQELPQEVLDLIQECEKSLYVLHHQRPTITVETKHITYGCYYNIDGEIEYESDITYALQNYSQVYKDLTKQKMTALSCSEDKAEQQKLIKRIENHETYGVQEQEGVQTVFVVSYQYTDTRLERTLMQVSSLKSAIKTAYRRLVELEDSIVLPLGYDSMADAMHDELLQNVLKYHTLDNIASYIKPLYTTLESFLSPIMNQVEKDVIKKCSDTIQKFSMFYVVEFYQHYVSRLVTQQLLTPFVYFSDQEKELPLQWSLVPHYDEHEVLKIVSEILEQTQHLAVQSVQERVDREAKKDEYS